MQQPAPVLVASVLTLLIGSMGCQRDTGDTTVVPVDTGTVYVGSGLPLWVYTQAVAEGASTLNTVDGDPLVQFDAVRFGPNFLGPTLVAEPDHEIFFQLTNDTSESVSITSAGVDVVAAPMIPSGNGDTTTIQTTTGVGTHSWQAGAGLSHGFGGLLTVRDPEAFPLQELDEHINVILFEPDPGIAQVNQCAISGVPDTGGGAGCPLFEPAVEGSTMWVFQRLAQAYFPENARHGGPPNEFSTATLPAPSTTLTAGNDVRVNVFNMTSSAHTIDLGGLPFGEGGAPLGELVLGAGEGTQLTGVAIPGPAEHIVSGVDCELPISQMGIVHIE